jgi:transcriptional regulator with XRE-family HTH domain
MLATMKRKTSFARRLRELRLAAELSQPGLAQRAKIGVSTVRQFEQGWREPTFGTFVKLCKGLGVPLSAFEE